MPRLSDTQFMTRDGLALPLRAWLPEDGAPRAVVLALHGFNDYSKAFEAAGADVLVYEALRFECFDGMAPE